MMMATGDLLLDIIRCNYYFVCIYNIYVMYDIYGTHIFIYM